MAPEKHVRLLPPLVMGGIVSVLLGSALGLFALLRLQLALGRVDVAWLQVHGQEQMFGFLVPFVAGFASYLFPRIAAGRRLMRGRTLLAGSAALWMGALFQLVGLITPAAIHHALLIFAAILVGTGSLAVSWALDGPLASLRSGGLQNDRGYERILEIALLMLAAAGVVGGVGLYLAAQAPDWTIPPALAVVVEQLILDGFGVGVAVGVSARMFPGFLGIDPRRHRPSRRLAFAWAGGMLLGTAATVADWPLLELAAELLISAALVRFALSLGLASRHGGPEIDRNRDVLFPWGARLAYAMLALTAALRAATAVAEAFGLPVHVFWRDVARHVLVLGFFMTLIATMAGRLAPGFARRPLAAPALRAFACFAFPASALLRSVEAVAGQWGPPGLLIVSSASGPLAAIAFLALAISLTLTLVRAPSPRTSIQGEAA